MEHVTDSIHRFIRRLQTEDVNMHGFLLSVGGKVAAKAYYAPFREGQPHRMYSVSKTFTGIAVGILAGDGRLSLDQYITEYFQDWLPDNPSPFLLRLTIHDMLRMATCYRRTAYREGIDTNWARSFFTGSPDHEPGMVFSYDTGCSQVLAEMVRRISGQEVIDFLEKRLFAPLGCQDPRYWLRDPSGCCQGGTGLCMSLRDLHAVALCLMDGGSGLVPEAYLREMCRKQINTPQRPFKEEQYGYGYQCWQTRAGWSMYGLGGQLCIACPEKQTLLTTVADTRLDFCGVQKIYDAFFEEVWPYTDREDMEPEKFLLHVRTLANRPAYALDSAGPFLFKEGNPLRLRSLELAGNELRYARAEEKNCRLPFSPGSWLKAEWPGKPQEPAVITAGWMAPGELRIRCHAAGNAPCGFEMLLCFRPGSVTVQSMRSWDPLTEGYDGVATGRQELP